MKKEYDFSNAEQGKFYKKNREIQLPVYLDKKVSDFFLKISKSKDVDLSNLVNKILLKEIEIQQSLVLKK